MLKNQVLNSKTLLTRSKLDSFSYLILGLIITVVFFPGVAFADLFIPTHEYIGYFDSEGIYTVVGNVKNEKDYAVLPTVTVSVLDDGNILSKTITHVPLASGKEIPFKVKFSELAGNTPVLMPSKISYEKTFAEHVPIEILYDKTLIKYDDGHLTGRIQNVGTETIYNPKVYAVVHGYERVLDVVQNFERIEKIEPGEILEFSMYPDPSVTDVVFYYSCFAPVDSTVTPVTAKKNDGKYDFRYDSGGWYYAAKFNEDGTEMTIRGTNSYAIPTYVNFEFPPISGDEKFSVLVNNEPIEFIQSLDEMENWHVAFDVEPQSQSIVTISGFPPGLPPERSPIPSWIKLSAIWWANDEISDIEFLEGIEFLVSKGVISVTPQESSSEFGSIPSWFKTTAAWWSENQTTDEDFLAAIENLLIRGIISL